MTQEQIEEHIYNVLFTKYKNPYGVCGLMGNLFAESGLNPKNVQNSSGYDDDWYTESVDNGTYAESQFVNDSIGYGLAQWTSSGRKQNLYNRKISENKSIGDIDLQLNFLIEEMNYGYPSCEEVIYNATSVRESAVYILIHFESPADQSQAVQDLRTEYAQVYYDKYASEEPPTPPTPPTPTENNIYSLIVKTPFHIKKLSESQIDFLKSKKEGDKVKLIYKYICNKKYGYDKFFKKIKKTNRSYIIISVSKNGYVELKEKLNSHSIYINPMYLKEGEKNEL